LLADPELLILDEPTTGLDPSVRHLLWEKVIELRDQGKTILVTTHYMHEAEVLCDQIVILDRGRVVGTGAPRELIERETLDTPERRHSSSTPAVHDALTVRSPHAPEPNQSSLDAYDPHQHAHSLSPADASAETSAAQHSRPHRGASSGSSTLCAVAPRPLPAVFPRSTSPPKP
jgi:ABC-type multidrug transport system ATPase subunit